MVNGELCGQKNLISLIDFRYSFSVFPPQYFLRKAASGLSSVRRAEAIPKEVPNLDAETRVQALPQLISRGISMLCPATDPLRIRQIQTEKANDTVSALTIPTKC